MSTLSLQSNARQHVNAGLCAEQGVELYNGQIEEGAGQISFHPYDPDLLCCVGNGGLTLWHVDKLLGQDHFQHVPVLLPGDALIALPKDLSVLQSVH